MSAAAASLQWRESLASEAALRLFDIAFAMAAGSEKGIFIFLIKLDVLICKPTGS